MTKFDIWPDYRGLLKQLVGFGELLTNQRQVLFGQPLHCLLVIALAVFPDPQLRPGDCLTAVLQMIQLPQRLPFPHQCPDDNVGLNTFTFVVADRPPLLQLHNVRYLALCVVRFQTGG